MGTSNSHICDCDGLNLEDIPKPWHEGRPDMDRLRPDHRSNQGPVVAEGNAEQPIASQSGS